MKIFVQDQGDHSVGIPSGRIVIETNSKIKYTEEERLYIKRKAREMFEAFYDPSGGIDIWFDDECPNCGQLLDKHDCGVEE